MNRTSKISRDNRMTNSKSSKIISTTIDDTLRYNINCY